MSEQRIVVERLCEHGEIESHYFCVDLSPAAYRRMMHDSSCECPGGSRRIVELPDMEKLKEAVDYIEDLRNDLGIAWKGAPNQDSCFAIFDQIAAAARWVLSLESE